MYIRKKVRPRLEPLGTPIHSDIQTLSSATAWTATDVSNALPILSATSVKRFAVRPRGPETTLGIWKNISQGDQHPKKRYKAITFKPQISKTCQVSGKQDSFKHILKRLLQNYH